MNDMNQTPINHEIVSQIIKESPIKNIGFASIRDLVAIVNKIEKATGQKYVRMEMGVPGLDVPQIGINAEIEALKSGAASVYGVIDGLPELKVEIARFAKLFLDINVNQLGCVPTVGSMQASMICFLVFNRMNRKRKTLFIDPGFPVQKLQHKVMGLEYETFDVYDFRGDKLKDKLESYLSTGEISTILYSNPNNPAWICFTDKELKIIGDLANKYDIIVLEDLAYIGMDFRKDYSKPGQKPFQPTVAKYTENYILMISSSKSFSYAGQRVGMMLISDALFNREYPDFQKYYTSTKLGYAMIYNLLYVLSAGVPHTPQYGLTAMLKAVNDGQFNFVDYIKVYGQKAAIVKRLFLENGFKIVYDKDEDDIIADGFYFTIFYPGLDGSDLLEKLLYYGISAIALQTTGSTRTEGLRACVSQIQPYQYNDLEYRLKKFNEHYGNLK